MPHPGVPDPSNESWSRRDKSTKSSDTPLEVGQFASRRDSLLLNAQHPTNRRVIPQPRAQKTEIQKERRHGRQPCFSQDDYREPARTARKYPVSRRQAINSRSMGATWISIQMSSRWRSNEVKAHRVARTSQPIHSELKWPQSVLLGKTLRALIWSSGPFSGSAHEDAFFAVLNP